MKPEVEIKIQTISGDEVSEVGQFLQKYFFPEEPLNASLQRCPETKDIPFLSVLKDGLSFKAVNVLENSKDNIAGTVVNKIVSFEKKSSQTPTNCSKTLKIRKILAELDESSKLWERVNYEDHFNIVTLSVNNKYRGLGIGRKLLEESLKLAKSLNYKYASIECSSFFSARIAVQLGFEIIGEICYNDYVDESKEVVFKISKPHVAIKKMIIRL